VDEVREEEPTLGCHDDGQRSSGVRRGNVCQLDDHVPIIDRVHVTDRTCFKSGRAALVPSGTLVDREQQHSPGPTVQLRSRRPRNQTGQLTARGWSNSAQVLLSGDSDRRQKAPLTSENVVETTTGVEVMRRYSNPPGTPVDLGELGTAPAERNDTETQIEPCQRHRRLRAADVRRLVDDYVAGATVPELIVAFGVNRTTVYAHLDRSGIPWRRGRGKLSEEQVRCAAELLRGGQGLPTIAGELGVGEETVRRALRRDGLVTRVGDSARRNPGVSDADEDDQDAEDAPD